GVFVKVCICVVHVSSSESDG
ncbi:hypothetical protein CSUI_004747, partial [Cystoisospora suis]